MSTTSSEAVSNVATVEFFEPPMCCPTGVCGPTQDQALLDLQETIRSLQSEGVRVVRFQPGSHPTEFGKNAEVMRAIRDRRLAALPITVVDGVLLKSGTYPTLSEIEAALGRGRP